MVDDIRTKIDALIEIVSKKKEVPLKEVSHLLNEDEDVIMDWAKALEEKGILSIKYRLTTPILSAEKVSKELLPGKLYEIGERKKAFLRKIHSLLERIEMEKENLKKYKKDYEGLRKELSKELSGLESSIEKFDLLKNRYLNSEREFRKSVEEKVRSVLTSLRNERTEIKRHVSFLRKNLKLLDRLEKDIWKEEERMVKLATIFEKIEKIDVQKLEKIAGKVNDLNAEINTLNAKLENPKKLMAKVSELENRVKKAEEDIKKISKLLKKIIS